MFFPSSGTVVHHNMHSTMFALAVVAGLTCGCGQRATEPPDSAPSAPPASPANESATAPAGPPLFKEMTPDSGVSFTCRNGEDADQFTILESLGGGVGLLDYDNDGRLDIFLAGGGYFDG